MDRRTFLSASAAGLIWSNLAFAQAIDICGVRFPDGTIGCRAGMTLSSALAIRANQRTSVWCWAASLEMIFRANGYVVPQEGFVEAVYRRLVDLPAFTGYAITNQLNRDWIDANNRRCRVEIEGLYDFDSHVWGITNTQIVNALRTGHPLLLCNTHHAMVLGNSRLFSRPTTAISCCRSD